MNTRLLVAMTALVALVAAGAAIAAWGRAPSPDAAVARVHLTVVGPTDAPLFDGDVEVAAATALSALRASGLAVETREYPGMGTYVVAIAGHRAHDAAGWVYVVTTGGEDHPGDRSAADRPLHKGDALAWRWTDG